MMMLYIIPIGIPCVWVCVYEYFVLFLFSIHKATETHRVLIYCVNKAKEYSFK